LYVASYCFWHGISFLTRNQTSVDTNQFLHILGSALAGSAGGEHPLPPQLLVGAGSGQVSRAAGIDGDYYWLRTLSHFAYLQQMDVQASTTEEQSSSDGLIAQLSRSTSMDEATDIVQTILLTKVGEIIMTAVTDIDASKPIYTYGVDSLVAVELRNWLALELKSDISIFDLTSGTPITEVCKKIAGKSQIVQLLEVEGKADGL
jgi:phosphopantetheine binding protein